MRLHGIAMQENLAAAAERHSGRRADHREGSVFEPPEYRLALLDELFDPGPVGDIGGEQREPEIDAERKFSPSLPMTSPLKR